MSYITKLPFEGKIKITYPYGVKDNNYKSGYHQGIDMVGMNNKNVYAICHGVVSYAGWENVNNKKQGFGQYVSIKFDETQSGFKKVFLAHLKGINVTAGQKVNNATIVGTMGSTGFSTGPHTHVEIREYNNNGKLIKILNSASYMGVPNTYTTIDSANYRIGTGSGNSNTNKYKIITKLGINLRNSYSTNSAKITAIPYNTEVDVSEFYNGNNWYWGKTVYNGKTGWFAIKTQNGKEIYAKPI